MHRLLPLPGPAVLFALAAFAAWLALPGVNAQTAPARPASAVSSAAASAVTSAVSSAAAEALQACERAARQSLATKGIPAAELKFVGVASEPPGSATEGRMVLQGAGTWRDGGTLRRFDYICNTDPRTPETVGLVIRDTTPASAEPRTPRAEIEPDLSHLSPLACESSAAAALKKRWPMVSEISFDTATRRLSQESPSRAELRGRGRALPSPGAPIVHFGFECVVDPRDGRVLNTGLAG